MKNFSQKNSCELISNGKIFIEKTVEVINEAKIFVFIHTYILKVDEVTGPIIHALKNATHRGVKVYVLVDAFGSKNLSESEIDIFRKNKIHFTFFKPLRQLNHFGRRLHQKVTIIDNQVAIVGGINMAKLYNLPDSMSPWLDYACVLKGEEVKTVFQKVLPLYLENFSHLKGELTTFALIDPKPQPKTCLVKTNVNDWMRYRSDVFKSYIQGIQEAQDSIYLIATYFIPGKKLLKALRMAKQRGVEINLIFGAQSDHPIVQKVEYYFYKWYLLNNFNIYEWQDSVVHGKLALIDNKWVNIGSYNHNYLSRFGNLELNLEIINKEFATVIKKEFEYVISRSKQFHKKDFEGRFTYLNQLYSMSAYFFLNVITLISIFFIYRRSKN